MINEFVMVVIDEFNVEVEHVIYGASGKTFHNKFI